jgi:hypothetical protein
MIRRYPFGRMLIAKKYANRKCEVGMRVREVLIRQNYYQSQWKKKTEKRKRNQHLWRRLAKRLPCRRHTHSDWANVVVAVVFCSWAVVLIDLIDFSLARFLLSLQAFKKGQGRAVRAACWRADYNRFITLFSFAVTSPCRNVTRKRNVKDTQYVMRSGLCDEFRTVFGQEGLEENSRFRMSDSRVVWIRR